MPIVLLCLGPETWLRRQRILDLKRQGIAPGFEELDFVRFPEPPAEFRAVLEAALILPFGSATRLVVVEGIEELDPELLSRLSGYLQNPNPRTCLVLCVERWEGEKGLLFPEFQRSGSLRIFWCRPLKGKDLKGWILDRARSLGKQMEPQAVELLVNRLGTDLESIAQALESLSLLVDSHPRIGVAEVEALITPSVQETAFDILDRAAGGRPEEALATLRQALFQGRLTIEQFLGALGWYYRMAWKFQKGAGAGSWLSPSRESALVRLKGWSERKLRLALEGALQAEVDLKSGHPAPELLADQMLLTLGI